MQVDGRIVPEIPRRQPPLKRTPEYNSLNIKINMLVDEEGSCMCDQKLMAAHCRTLKTG